MSNVITLTRRTLGALGALRRVLTMALLFWNAEAAGQEPTAPTTLPPVPGKDFELRPEGRPADVLRSHAHGPTEGGFTQRSNLNAELSWKPREDHRLTARAYLTDYQLSLFNDFTLFLNDPVGGDEIIENLTNASWRESQLFFTSRLPGEPAAGVSDIHLTPGNPRSFLGGIALHF